MRSNMYMKSKLVLAVILSIQIQIAWAQSRISYNKKGQAVPSAVQPFGEEAFDLQDGTIIRWLGNAGFFINSRGTCRRRFHIWMLCSLPIAITTITAYLHVRSCQVIVFNIIVRIMSIR